MYTDKELIILYKTKSMLPEVKEERKCLACNKTLLGRVDKKFCNDYCRNTYTNQMKATPNSTVRKINHTLLKNRRVLETVLGTEETAMIAKEKLLRQGFQFNYITHTYANKKGSIYYFCYDLGYLPLENDLFLVVKRKEEVSHNI